jgi:hypothetical protein
LSSKPINKILPILAITSTFTERLTITTSAHLSQQQSTMETIPARKSAPETSAEDPSDNAQYTSLKDHLTDPQYPLDDIRTRLNDDRLTDAEARNLFGSIRKSVLDIILQHKELEAWIFRCTRMGSAYAQAMTQEGGAGADAVRIDFYGHQDFHLEMSGGARDEVVAMILQHVGVYREAVQGVERLQGEKESMLVDERRGSDSAGV